MLNHDGHDWIFSSGRKRYGYTERLSIEFSDDGKPSISYGYDGGFWDGFGRWDATPKLTKEDLLELAELQIQRWQQFVEWLSHSAGEQRG